jgi:hypothetical protein
MVLPRCPYPFPARVTRVRVGRERLRSFNTMLTAV